VVVRHSRHGGLLAPVTGDRFLSPTRAPHELRTALRLAAAGVPTPEVVAYATYPAGPLLRRSDVATREVEGGRDLAAWLIDRPAEGVKRELLRATAVLLARLADAGARHPDLNLKNVLLVPVGDGRFDAHVLDVDRIAFGRYRDPRAAEANLARLARSARKWRVRHGADISEGDLARLPGGAMAS
jgi:3-deoxy-D-manno-octulosonic acid kinase